MRGCAPTLAQTTCSGKVLSKTGLAMGPWAFTSYCCWRHTQNKARKDTEQTRQPGLCQSMPGKPDKQGNRYRKVAGRSQNTPGNPRNKESKEPEGAQKNQATTRGPEHTRETRGSKKSQQPGRSEHPRCNCKAGLKQVGVVVTTSNLWTEDSSMCGQTKRALPETPLGSSASLAITSRLGLGQSSPTLWQGGG